ncbi:Uncharacterized protein conserved in bacteria, NMA0228-like [uncultured Candidatus Thioglobus sp.]|nr:Uncharacterized protein conserved in bacteria, NMA0228-like [uncultured Candidatus Thioglobus sp.]
MDIPHHFCGFGLGLRKDHYQHVLEHRPEIDWFEVLSDNYMVEGGKPRYFLDAIREHYPMVMHGVSLSIGSTDPLNIKYLQRLKALADVIQPRWISDHLCWTTANNINSHDLLPLPYNEEALNHLSQRIQTVQDYLQYPFLIENLSSYLTYNNSEMEEWEFLNEIAKRSNCKILLDINNIYVSSRNHDFLPEQYINGIDKDAVWQFHLAGHTDYGDYVVDTHDHDVPDPVWSLYRYALRRFGAISTMIERDDHIPPFDELYAELQIAKKIAEQEIPNITQQLITQKAYG